MKKLLVLICIVFSISVAAFSQTVSTANLRLIAFKLKNNSILPTKVTVISYRPDETGNGTTAFFLAPYANKAYEFPAGTKIYLANQQQVDVVMSGATISQQKPFLVVKKEDEGKTFNIK